MADSDLLKPYALARLAVADANPQPCGLVVAMASSPLNQRDHRDAYQQEQQHECNEAHIANSAG
jgi:hypothetical protein